MAEVKKKDNGTGSAGIIQKLSQDEKSNLVIM